MSDRSLMVAALFALLAVSCGEETVTQTELVPLPVLLLAPDGLTFTHVERSCSKETRRFCVENRATQSIGLESIAIAQFGGGEDFSISHVDGDIDPARIGGTQIGPGQRLCFDLRYSPKDAGIHSATVSVKMQGFVDPLALEVGGTSDATKIFDDVFDQSRFNRADFLFVIDNSPGMADVRERVNVQLETMFAEIERLFDYQVAVTTSDPNTLGTLFPVGPSIPTPPITPSTNDAAAVFREAIRAPQSSSFLAVNAFDAVVAILGRSFLNLVRERSTLVLVFVSDRDDTSEGSPELFASLFSRLSRPGQTAMAMTFVNVGFDPFGCLDADPPSIVGTRFMQLAQTMFTYTDNVCSESYSTALFNVPGAFGMTTFYQLRQVPMESTIRVFVTDRDGVQTENTQWHYEAPSRAVVFDFVAPPSGSVVTVRYEVKCE